MRKFNVTVNGETYQVEVEELGAAQSVQTAAPQPVAAPAAAPAQTKKPVISGNGTKVTAPMPGNIVKLVAKEGATVKKGDVLFVLEAMKMENDIVSTADGKISINVSEGAAVSSGDVLAVIA